MVHGTKLLDICVGYTVVDPLGRTGETTIRDFGQMNILLQILAGDFIAVACVNPGCCGFVTVGSRSTGKGALLMRFVMTTTDDTMAGLD